MGRRRFVVTMRRNGCISVDELAGVVHQFLVAAQETWNLPPKWFRLQKNRRNKRLVTTTTPNDVGNVLTSDGWTILQIRNEIWRQSKETSTKFIQTARDGTFCIVKVEHVSNSAVPWHVSLVRNSEALEAQCREMVDRVSLENMYAKGLVYYSMSEDGQSDSTTKKGHWRHLYLREFGLDNPFDYRDHELGVEGVRKILISYLADITKTKSRAFTKRKRKTRKFLFGRSVCDL